LTPGEIFAYEAGVAAGYERGLVDGLSVLDDAARALAALRPSRGVDYRDAKPRRLPPDPRFADVHANNSRTSANFQRTEVPA
jgi:hypothetical protein